jgi:hypothetical protein
MSDSCQFRPIDSTSVRMRGAASICCECEVAHTPLAISPSKARDSEVGSGARRQTWHRNQIALHLGSRWSLRWR